MKNKFNIAMVGGRGYVGQEIIGILNNHPLFILSKVFSSSAAGKSVSEYTKAINLNYSLLEDSNIDLEGIDLVIMALPNDDSYKYIKLIDKKYPDIIIIDLSSDHRFNSDWQYRVPEISNLQSSNRISNPGCYASAMQFSLEPIKALIKGKVSCVGISGFSGAGASPNEKNDPENLKDNIIPYSLSGHTHEQEVTSYCYKNLSFSPHVGNFFRGILITSHIELKDKYSNDKISSLFKNYYESSNLVSISEHIPMINKVINSHKVFIGGITVDESGKNLTICCVLDNLLKGAATQVIQNLNSACGIDELTGINYE